MNSKNYGYLINNFSSKNITHFWVLVKDKRVTVFPQNINGNPKQNTSKT